MNDEKDILQWLWHGMSATIAFVFAWGHTRAEVGALKDRVKAKEDHGERLARLETKQDALSETVVRIEKKLDSVLGA